MADTQSPSVNPVATGPSATAEPATTEMDWYLVLTSPLDTPGKVQEVTESPTPLTLELRSIPSPSPSGDPSATNKGTHPATPTSTSASSAVTVTPLSTTTAAAGLPRRCVRLPPDDGKAKVTAWWQRHKAIYTPTFFALPVTARPAIPTPAPLPPPRAQPAAGLSVADKEASASMTAELAPASTTAATASATAGAGATASAPQAALRPAKDVLDRLRWDPDPGYAASDYIVVYEDRFLGPQELALAAWTADTTDEEFIPQHRILRFKRKADGLVIWDREKRVDLVFGSGVGAG